MGADADSILRLSYLDADVRRELFAGAALKRRSVRSRSVRNALSLRNGRSPEPGSSSPAPFRREHSSHGDRVRIFGDVSVREDERVGGAAVAVMGSVRIDGEVDQDVVAVLGSVELGPHAVVRGDVVTVGGRLNRAATAQVGGAVTEVALGDPGVHVNSLRGSTGSEASVRSRA